MVLAGGRQMAGNHRMHPLLQAGLVLSGLVLAGLLQAWLAPPGAVRDERAGASGVLQISEQPEQVVLTWVGRVDGSMARQFDSALRTHRYDERSFVVVLNSAGGEVRAGVDVIKGLGTLSKARSVETTVAGGGICASMCVPIYMTGNRRTAHAEARFMFHEAREARIRRTNDEVTDYLFYNHMSYEGIDDSWLQRTRRSIQGGKDVWHTGKQLFDERTGVVHAINR
jgi:Clp protease